MYGTVTISMSDDVTPSTVPCPQPWMAHVPMNKPRRYFHPLTSMLTRFAANRLFRSWNEFDCLSVRGLQHICCTRSGSQPQGFFLTTCRSSETLGSSSGGCALFLGWVYLALTFSLGCIDGAPYLPSPHFHDVLKMQEAWEANRSTVV